MAEHRRPLVAGNWKMNGCAADLGEIVAIRDYVVAAQAGFGAVGSGTVGSGAARSVDVVLCPPATLLMSAAKLCAGSVLALGGQDCHAAAGGAHTGDIAAEMLSDAGASYVIVGHSERRADHGETNALICAKAAAGLRAGLSIILCVGETRAERQAGEALAKVGGQLMQSLPALQGPEQAGRLSIAYEPVWAIGTGLTPTRADVAAMHGFLRRELKNHLGESADAVRILYGGSVKPGNASELLTVSDVDGTLVGGASLKAGDFLPILQVFAKPAR
jgi:triosephosphate isomerase (TIM)